MVKNYEYDVEMTCEGCVNAVKRILDRYKELKNFEIFSAHYLFKSNHYVRMTNFKVYSILGKGVEDYNIDLSQKLVSIQGSLKEDEMTAIIKKCGKGVILKSFKDE